VFYEWEYKSHDYGHNYDGQAGDIGGIAATRELFAGTFCDLHDAVDGGISFLLFVGAVGGFCGDDSAGGAFAAGAGVREFTTENAEGTEAEQVAAIRRKRRAAFGAIAWPLKKEKTGIGWVEARASWGAAVLRPYTDVLVGRTVLGERLTVHLAGNGSPTTWATFSCGCRLARTDRAGDSRFGACAGIFGFAGSFLGQIILLDGNWSRARRDDGISRGDRGAGYGD